jgi:hypothetical protein
MRKTILGAVLVLAMSNAYADDKAKAKKLYDEGLKHYNVAEYPDAIKAWKEAYLLSKKPLLLFNIGQAFRLSGDCKQALVFYDSYQREEPSPKNQDELDKALELCKDTKPAVTPPPKPVDKPVVTTQPPKPADKPVVTTQPPKPADKPVVAAPPPVAQVEPVHTEPVDGGPTTTGGGLRKVGIGVGIAGVVLGGVGIYFALDSNKASSDLDGFSGPWGQEQIDLEAQGKRSATLGWVFGISGVAAVAAGGVMFAIGGPKAGETSSVSVVPTRGGGQLTWSHRF